ncbi:MAG: ABC transporter permease [Methanomassiliicoccales archaeon]|nr:MAG: ABC transporter permease [Methanomassiliicoccales archaeon]
MISDIYTIWLREMIRYVRSKSRIISSLAMPIIWLALLGTAIGGMVEDSPFLPHNMNYIQYIAPGIIGMTILFTSIFSGISIIFDREFGFLKEILVAPVSRLSIVLGKALGGTTTAMIQGMIMFILGILLGVKFSSEFGIGLGFIITVAFMFLIGLSFVSLGIAIASKIESMEGFQMIMSFLVMPMFFLSGALYPIETLPDWLKLLTYIDPLTYGIDGLRGSIQGSSVAHFPLLVDFGVLSLFCLFTLLLSAYLFKKS